jgi:hypothetical protein
MKPTETLARFDGFLATERLRLEAVVVGGAALGLLGIITRETRDCDVVEPSLPPELLDAAHRFAAESRSRGEVLKDDWLNNGPSSLTSVLPAGWRDRLQRAFSGRALLLQTLTRSDLLKTKLFALCDRGLDIKDCLAMNPSAGELAESLPWLEQQNFNPDWPAHVRATLVDLGRKLGHGV